MVNEILGTLAGGAIGCVGYLLATLKATKREVKINGVLHDKEARIKELIQKCNEHSNAKKVIQEDYDQLKQEFQQLADEHAERKEDNAKLAAGNNSIAKDYHELKEKYDKLKETYAPLATLNPFERQAVGAMTDQSQLDEWLNGPREEK
jgi:chromosome segregation ATPase